jgi:hypothetical protein
MSTGEIERFINTKIASRKALLQTIDYEYNTFYDFLYQRQVVENDPLDEFLGDQATLTAESQTEPSTPVYPLYHPLIVQIATGGGWYQLFD